VDDFMAGAIRFGGLDDLCRKRSSNGEFICVFCVLKKGTKEERA
jgi:hypothetical protein